jgi:hypothetical protein
LLQNRNIRISTYIKGNKQLPQEKLDTHEKYIGGHIHASNNSSRKSSRLSRKTETNNLAFGQSGEGKLFKTPGKIRNLSRNFRL